MRTQIKITALFVFITLFAQAQNTVKITIKDLKSSQGEVMLELVDANDRLVAQEAVTIRDKQAVVEITDLKKGTYAIRYYHDENGNGKMDTGTFGIPLEGYGFSNNARGFMGPPDFEDITFEMNDDLTMNLITKN